MKLRLSISTCPNDTFMFYGLVGKRVDTEGLEFDLTLADIQQLNLGAIAGEPHITKMSYAVYPQVESQYRISNSGSALGRGNGPLLVSRRKIYPDEAPGVRIAVPGRHTTANLLMERLFPGGGERGEYLFSDIAEAVLSGECDAGVLIHEGRFLYKSLGLQLIADLGVLWEKETAMPLPLGAIAVSRELDGRTQKKVERVVRRSVEYALANPREPERFVKQYAQEMDDKVIESHIELFVNSWSVDLGDQGREAVKKLLGTDNDDIFV